MEKLDAVSLVLKIIAALLSIVLSIRKLYRWLRRRK